ncbi:MAG: SPOR domain-containing protein [Dongiaceae bacterium]
MQRRQPVLDPVYSQDRILTAAARAAMAANQPGEITQEPQLFPDLAVDDGDSGPEIPPRPSHDGPAAAPGSAALPDGPGRTRPLLWIGIVAVSAFAIFVPLLMLMNQSERTVVADADLPVVAAEQGPEKMRPANEGGMRPLNQDVAIYDTLSGEAKSQTEVLLGQPETPMPLPPPAPAETAPAGSDKSSDASGNIPQVPAPAFDVTDDAAAAASNVEPSAGGGSASEAAPETPAAPAESTITDVVDQTASLGAAYRVQLAAVKTKDGARETWAKLQKKHAQLLSGKELTVVEIDKGSDGKFYRVQAGPFNDRAAATDACVALKKLEQGCMVVAP